MPIDDKMKKYPICDADIWIKSCKTKEEEKIFELYEKLFFSEAVIQELSNKKKDDPSNLGLGFDYLEKYCDKYHEMDLNDGKFFNSKERRTAKRLFVQNKIDYDDVNKSFPRQEHLGEKVSLVYAAIHKLDLMLSDDNGSKKYKGNIHNKFKMVKIINFVDFLTKIGYSKEEAEKIRDEVSKSQKELEAENQMKERGTLNSLSLLKAGMIRKGKMI